MKRKESSAFLCCFGAAIELEYVYNSTYTPFTHTATNGLGLACDERHVA